MLADEANDDEDGNLINAPTVGSSCMTNRSVIESYHRGSSVSRVSSDYHSNRGSLDGEHDEFEERDDFESRDGQFTPNTVVSSND